MIGTLFRLVPVGLAAYAMTEGREKMTEVFREAAERPVTDVMLPIKAKVSHDDNLIKAIDAMVKNDISLVPVVRDGRVAGVVRSVDVLHEIAQLVL